MAPRGGSGNGALPVTQALVKGQVAPLRVPPPPPSTPAIPFLPPTGGAPGTGPIGGFPTAPASHSNANAPAASPPQALSITPATVATTPTKPTGPVVINENPSSLPYTTTGNFSGASMEEFQYFPLYTVDYDTGTVFFPNTYQLATLNSFVDLRAQTTGATGVTYSWNTSGLTEATSISGGSTYDLTFDWVDQPQMSATVNSVTLTATDSGGQQESQTYYFEVPGGEPGASGGSTSWPSTLSPDTVNPNAPVWTSDYVTVNSDSGALDTSITLPTYNPNVNPNVLTYDSITANPLPIILVPHSLDPTQAVPSEVSAQLTFDGTALTTYYYNTSSFTPGDIEQIALQATNASSLATGRYAYSVQIIDYRSGVPTTFTYSGDATVLNQSSSSFGDGWTLQGLEQITSASGGVILNTGTAGASLWFSGSPGSGGGTYDTPAANFSTLTLNSNGTYTQTQPDGTQINFSSGGYEMRSRLISMTARAA